MNFEALLTNYPYLVSVIIFAVGTLIVLTQPNLIKKVIGLNVMTNAIFLFFIALGNIEGGEAPIVDPAAPAVLYVNPLPSALILTGIVVSFSVTAFAMALIVKLYFFYGTLNAPDFMKMR
ncbi:MAG: cation:proton antiporter subunit C [Bacillota bacterium]